jgi:hypothetical protein
MIVSSVLSSDPVEPTQERGDLMNLQRRQVPYRLPHVFVVTEVAHEGMELPLQIGAVLPSEPRNRSSTFRPHQMATLAGRHTLNRDPFLINPLSRGHRRWIAKVAPGR